MTIEYASADIGKQDYLSAQKKVLSYNEIIFRLKLLT